MKVFNEDQSKIDLDAHKDYYKNVAETKERYKAGDLFRAVYNDPGLKILSELFIRFNSSLILFKEISVNAQDLVKLRSLLNPFIFSQCDRYPSNFLLLTDAYYESLQSKNGYDATHKIFFMSKEKWVVVDDFIKSYDNFNGYVDNPTLRNEYLNFLKNSQKLPDLSSVKSSSKKYIINDYLNECSKIQYLSSLLDVVIDCDNNTTEELLSLVSDEMIEKIFNEGACIYIANNYKAKILEKSSKRPVIQKIYQTVLDAIKNFRSKIHSEVINNIKKYKEQNGILN